MIDFNNPYYYLGMLIAFVLNYLIGSLNWSIIIGKVFYKIDVRDYYSHNAGATNSNRKLGSKVASVILLLDALKVTLGMFATFTISLIENDNVSFSQISYYIPVIFVALGHAYPIYFKFRGGKCASIVMGFSLMINPIYFLILFITYWTLLPTTRYVSFSSMFSAFFLGLVIWIPYLSGVSNFINSSEDLSTNHFLYFNLLHNYVPKYNNKSYYDNLLIMNLSLELIIIFTIFLHRSNIKRLIKKEEYKVTFKKNKNN